MAGEGRRREEGTIWHGRRGRLVLLLTGGGVVGGDADINCWMREKEKKVKGKLAVEELLLLWRKKDKQSVEREKCGGVDGGIGG
jgi:hypothetical protein